jgi:hypothetical protein
MIENEQLRIKLAKVERELDGLRESIKKLMIEAEDDRSDYVFIPDLAKVLKGELK